MSTFDAYGRDLSDDRNSAMAENVLRKEQSGTLEELARALQGL